MCGIAGFIGSERNQPVLDRMCASLAHRGPESAGMWSSEAAGRWIGLAHRRLRILDISERADQPMHRVGLSIIFNGEIYNFRELREELKQQGERFATESDTEVILAAYSRWGKDCATRLDGMFAFALWDATHRELFLVRDRLGKKPLYYSERAGRIVFGSEIKAILAGLEKTPEPDFEALDQYLTYLYIPYPKTIFEGIRQLEPGNWISFELKPERIARSSGTYWRPLAALDARRPRPFAENTGRLRDLLADSVGRRLVSDVPLGVLLSGGLDSSAITALMAQRSTESIRSFSVGFPDDRTYDEIPFAKLVAERIGCQHEVLAAKPPQLQLLPDIVRHFDQPFGNPTALLAYNLSALTKQSVTVALGGDGGDELWGGYPRYVGAYVSNLPRALPRFFHCKVFPWFGRQMADDTNGRHQARRLREFVENCGKPLIEMYLEWLGYFSAAEKARLYQSEFATVPNAPDAGDFLRNLYREAESLEPLNRLAYVDIKSFLCCNVLEYSDRMSMAHALELRAPFCDHRLVEFSLGVPFDQKFRFGESKWLLKRALKDLLPVEVLKRRKLGFNPPVGSWLKKELRGALALLLDSASVSRRGLFRYDEIERMLELQFSGKRDLSLKIWALLVLELWFRIYQEGHSAESMAEQLERAVQERAPQFAMAS